MTERQEFLRIVEKKERRKKRQREVLKGNVVILSFYLGSATLKHMSVLLLRSLTKSDALEDQQSGLGK